MPSVVQDLGTLNPENFCWEDFGGSGFLVFGVQGFRGLGPAWFGVKRAWGLGFRV